MGIPVPQMPEGFRFSIVVASPAGERPGEPVMLSLSRPGSDSALPGGLTDVAGELSATLLDVREGIGEYRTGAASQGAGSPDMVGRALELVDGEETHLLLIERITVDQRYRACRPDLRMAVMLIQFLSAGRTLRVMFHPLPGSADAGREAATGAEDAARDRMDTRDLTDGQQLIRYWRRVGFEPTCPGSGLLTMRARDGDPENLYQQVFSQGQRRKPSGKLSAGKRAFDPDPRVRFGLDEL
jgi:hypothetical protein